MTASGRISHYRLEGLLGAGGMGEVHVAFDEHLQRRVALKLLPAARALDVGARARMLREARAASALQHPGIVTIHEIGADEDGRTFIVMELVDGETFAQLLARRGKLPVDEAVALIAQVADAVGAAHEAGILHRDLKPANLILDRRGHVKVLDFGLSKRVGAPSVEPASRPPRASRPVSADASTAAPSPVSADAPTATPDPAYATSGDAPTATPDQLGDAVDLQTVDGARMGTPGYAALELVRGDVADARSDVFSLAVVLHELVAGDLPYPGTTWTALLAALEAGRPRPGPDPRLDAALAPALRPDPADRYPDVATLVARARAAIAPPRRARSAWWVLGATAAAGAAIGGAWITRDHGRDATVATPPPDAAPRLAATPRALTATSACAYSPTFVDAATVAFDLTKDGAIDLYAVAAAGGEPRKLVGTPMMEWRAAPGTRPGELVYLSTDTGENGSNYIDAVVVATGVTRRVAELATDSVATIGDALIYVNSVGPDIRRHTADRDDVIASLPSEHAARLITVSADGRHAATPARVGAGNVMCVADLVERTTTCPIADMLPARPAFGADGTALYYATNAGIRRHALASPDGTQDPLVVARGNAVGGIAVAPDGHALVWSTCGAKGRLIDVAAPAAPIVRFDGSVDDLAVANDGTSVFVETVGGRRIVMARDAAGAVRELTSPGDPTPRWPALSPDATNVAYVLAGDAAGVYVQPVTADVRASPIALTQGAATPRWLDDHRVAFLVWDERQVYWISIYDLRDDTLTRIDAPRILWGRHPRTGELLVSRDGQDGLWWRDLSTGKERRWEPRDLPPSTMITDVSQSPDGRWLVVQTGQMSNRAMRIDVLAADPVAELVYEASQDDTVGRFAITDDGRVFAAPNGWSGDLMILDGTF